MRSSEGYRQKPIYYCVLLSLLLLSFFLTPLYVLQAEEAPDLGQSPSELPMEEVAGPTQPPVAESVEEMAPLALPFEARADRLSILLPFDGNLEELFAENRPDLISHPFLAEEESFRLLSQLLTYPLNLQNDKLQLGILSSWEWSENGKEVKLRLKPDLTWSDGSPITSRDLLFSMQNLMKSEVKANAKLFAMQIEGVKEAQRDPKFDPQEAGDPYSALIKIKGLETPNDSQLLIRFTSDFRNYEADLLAMPIIPMKSWYYASPRFWSEKKNNGKEASALGGPYRLLPYRKDYPTELDLQSLAVPGMIQTQIPKIKLRFAPANNIAQALLENQADVALLPALGQETRDLLIADGYKLEAVPSDFIHLLQLNKKAKDNPFNNPKLSSILKILLNNPTDFAPTWEEQLISRANENLPLLPFPQEKNSVEKELPTDPEEIQSLALELLLKAGYYSPLHTLEALQGYEEKNPDQELTPLPEIILAYPAGELLFEEVAYHLSLNLQNLGFPVRSFALNPEDLTGDTELSELAHLILASSHKGEINLDMPTLPLFSPKLSFAWKRIEGFQADSLEAFSSSILWSLPQK